MTGPIVKCQGKLQSPGADPTQGVAAKFQVREKMASKYEDSLSVLSKKWRKDSSVGGNPRQKLIFSKILKKYKEVSNQVEPLAKNVVYCT